VLFFRQLSVLQSHGTYWAYLQYRTYWAYLQYGTYWAYLQYGTYWAYLQYRSNEIMTQKHEAHYSRLPAGKKSELGSLVS